LGANIFHEICPNLSQKPIKQRRFLSLPYLKGKMLTETVYYSAQCFKTKLLKESDKNIFQESGESEI